MKHRFLKEASTQTASSGTLAEYESAADDLYRPGQEPSEDGDDGLGICTVGARHIAMKYNGSVMGYLSHDNPDATLGAEAGGHDFALLDDRYIVDPWAKHVSTESRAALDLHDPHDRIIAARLYGNRSAWSAVP